MSKYGVCLLAFVGVTACGGGMNVPGQAGNEVSEPGKQYRAVCLEEAVHGSVHVLSRWLDDRAKAFELGNLHGEVKDKGHSWKLEERAKPQTDTP
jgi:hypothetical protein